MKERLLTLFVGAFLFASLYSQDVSTDVQKKKILLEEFTGIHCGNCPDGHEIARNLLNAQEDNFYTIAIHSGYYSAPRVGDPDFRIEEGEEIDVEFEAFRLGYPSGTINRHDFDGSDMVVTGRGNWTINAKKIHEEDAPVNLLLESEFDKSTRELKITVKGYYTLDVENAFHLLNIAVTQNNIKGYQNGRGTGSDYIHNHMLRAFVTPMWGDTIKSPKKQDSFTRTYTYTLPADINSLELIAEEIEIIVFVAADKREILNVTGGKPVYKNYSEQLKATVINPAWVIGNSYAYNYFEAKIKNESEKTITSIKFGVTINDDVQHVEWTGNIEGFHTKAITIHVEPYDIIDNNNYEIKVASLNNQNVNGNSIKGSFKKPALTTDDIFIEIMTDLFADENTYTIKDRDGNIVQEFGPYEKNKREVYKEKAKLESEKIYCFEVTDKWGNGIQTTRGYKIYNDDNATLVAQNYEIKLFGDRFFFKTSYLPTSLKDIEYGQSFKADVLYNATQKNIELSYTTQSSENIEISVYSITGVRLLSKSVSVFAGQTDKVELFVPMLNSGMYLVCIQQCANNEAHKVIIH